MKLLNKISALLCSIILSAGCVVSAYANENNPESLTIIGDSIASGYGLEGYVSGNNYSAENYGKLLCGEYGITSMNYFNYAVDGETTEGLLYELENGSYDIGIRSSNVIVVSIGGNDLLDAIIGENSAVFKNSRLDEFLKGEANITELLADLDLVEITNQLSNDAQEKLLIFNENIPKIIKAISEKNPQAYIIIQTLYNPMNSGIEIIDNLYGQTISQLNTGIDGIEGCVVADVNSAFAQSEEKLIQNDFTHPNEKGHKVIFEVIKAVIDDCYSLKTENEKPSDSPVSTQPVATTTVTTTTITESTTTTTPDITTANPNVTLKVSVDDDDVDNENSNQKVIPLIIMPIVIFVVLKLFSLNKNGKN
ncbi:MAG: SGNH/GDSL hydrolase family protein [Ruminococcus sp.]|nr:SGNH/GDSL hydrolase family protein [Ruminococcus sp.]